MDKLNKLKIKNLTHSLALKYNLSDNVVKDIIESPYAFTANKLSEINNDLNSAVTEEEIEKLKTTFLYKSFFKIYISKAKLLTRNKRRKNINEVNKNRWEKNSEI
jgi:hypothetical protein